MERTQVETWALRIARAAQEGTAPEDSAVELKSEWPSDHPRAARQIAGLANASRSRYVMWLIGVDEDKGVVPFDHVEVSEWWGSVSRSFDPPSPILHNVATYLDGQLVVALVFDAAARPFVTKNPDGGAYPFVVPWRGANRTRTANRAELLTILEPVVSQPKLEVLEFELRARRPMPGQEQEWRVYLEVYVEQFPADVLVLPRHRCRCLVEVPEFRIELDIEEVYFSYPGAKHGLPSPHDGVVSGPGRIAFDFESKWQVPTPFMPPLAPTEAATVSVSLMPTMTEVPVTVQAVLLPKEDVEPHYWGSWELASK